MFVLYLQPCYLAAACLGQDTFEKAILSLNESLTPGFIKGKKVKQYIHAHKSGHDLVEVEAKDLNVPDFLGR